MRPLTLTLGGEVQNIFYLLSLATAKATPTDITAGSAGGTVIVIKSNALIMSLFIVVPCSSYAGNDMANPTTVKTAINPTK